MKREIKFRGKSTKNGTWYFGSLVHDTKYDLFDIEWFDSLGQYSQEVLSETVGQFTGLKDKNGKEIYEGDFDDGNCVTWCNECNGWQFAGYDIESGKFYLNCHCCEGNFMFKDLIHDFEVIGNIHDNPELLK